MPKVCRNDAAKRALLTHYETFRSAIPDTEARWVPTRFGDTHVLIAGREDAPPLLLLHGAFGNSAHMLSAFTSILDRFRIYAVDTIGASVMSPDARLSYDGSAVGEWIVDVMDALGLAKAHVYGASLGGFLARKLAEHAPERIDRLVLLVPAGFVDPTYSTFFKLLVPMMIYRAFPTRERLIRFLEPMMTNLEEDWIDYFGAAFGGFTLDMRKPPLATTSKLAGFDRPTLVIGADDDLFFDGETLLARVKEVMPHAETELLAGCRHVPPTQGGSMAEQAARLVSFLGVASPGDLYRACA